MSKRSYHWRYFDKTKPIPAWLVLEMEVIARVTNPCVRHRLSYYRQLWLATPPWANEQAIKAIYVEAHSRRLLGEDVEVDHIIPLKGHLVNGLHCEQNLRIISRKHNSFLSNRRYPGCPQLELLDGLNNL